MSNFKVVERVSNDPEGENPSEILLKEVDTGVLYTIFISSSEVDFLRRDGDDFKIFKATHRLINKDNALYEEFIGITEDLFLLFGELPANRDRLKSGIFENCEIRNLLLSNGRLESIFNAFLINIRAKSILYELLFRFPHFFEARKTSDGKGIDLKEEFVFDVARYINRDRNSRREELRKFFIDESKRDYGVDPSEIFGSDLDISYGSEFFFLQIILKLSHLFLPEEDFSLYKDLYRECILKGDFSDLFHILYFTKEYNLTPDEAKKLAIVVRLYFEIVKGKKRKFWYYDFTANPIRKAYNRRAREDKEFIKVRSASKKILKTMEKMNLDVNEDTVEVVLKSQIIV